jgi:hypothetical protein
MLPGVVPGVVAPHAVEHQFPEILRVGNHIPMARCRRTLCPAR